MSAELGVMVVDDEPLARQRMLRMIAELPGYQVVAEAENGLQALQVCRGGEVAPDIICLDIRMPGMDGMELAMELAQWPQPPAVIFCTAYGDYALQAFEASAVDYLLKPVRQEKLMQALAKAQIMTVAQLEQLAAGGTDVAAEPPAGLTAKRRGVIHRIALDQVRALVAEHKYVTLYHSDGEDLLDDSLKQLEERYPDRLLRVHRNTLVSKAHILGLERDALGRYQLLLKDCDYRPVVSRRHVRDVKALLTR